MFGLCPLLSLLFLCCNYLLYVHKPYTLDGECVHFSVIAKDARFT